MNLKESIKLGIKQLLSNKGRTFLTMLGMFIGVGSVVLILAIGAGFKEYTMKSFGDIGLGRFNISCKDQSDHLLITQDDLDLIMSMPEIQTITGIIGGNAEIYNQDGVVKSFSITGGNEAYLTDINKLDLLAGRLHTQKDNQIAAKVIIISDVFAKIILRETNYKKVIGESVELLIDNHMESFEIIGVYKASVPANASEAYLERTLSNQTLYLPKKTLELVIKSDGRVSYAIGIVQDSYDPKEITNQVRILLNRRHGQKDNYTISRPADFMEEANSMMNVITLFISAVAGISLLVGGIGIMNIMLVTVKERTREIGIRKALGATNRVILSQFLIEALILTIIAGIIGMLIGYIGSIVIGANYDLQPKLTLGMILFSVGTSTAIGVVFGVYPAYQAARLDPIDALRCE